MFISARNETVLPLPHVNETATKSALPARICYLRLRLMVFVS
jgi:hypothetical protein